MLKQLLIAGLVMTLGACATVPTVGVDVAAQVKEVVTPPEGKSGIYVYRSNSVVGAALKKDIWIDGKCIGESARGVVFYEEVEGDQEHIVATESEFSPNLLTLNTEQGKNYFVQQYIKMGAFVGGANLRLVDAVEGKNAIATLAIAQKGKCSKAYPVK